MTKKILCICVAAITAVSSAASAVDFSFTSFAPQDPIGEKFADAHFFTPGNDYAGSFFRLPTVQSLPATQVVLGSSIRNCTKQVRGLYFSNAWGARLRPMDEQTLDGLAALDPSYNDLNMDGGLFTSCTNTGSSNNTGLELYSVYGQVNYTWKGKSFSINMGRRYNILSNSVLPGAPMVSSIQYFNNQTPIGYFYDNIAGVGFIGGTLPIVAHTGLVDNLNAGGHINDVFRFNTGSTTELLAVTPGGTYVLSDALSAGIGTLWRIAVLGNILLSKGGLSANDRRSVLGNPNQTSSIMVSDKMNIANSINQLKRNAANLCRGRVIYNESNYGSAPDGIVCIGSSSDTFNENDPIEIDLSDSGDYENKTFIVYNKNVQLSNSMPEDDDYALNIFVDRGNVLLADPAPDANFDANGNLGGSIPGMYIRGNIFINGLILGDEGEEIPHKLYIHGKFASLNSGLEPTQGRTSQVAALFNNASTTYGDDLTVDGFCNSNNCINLNNIFTRQCEVSGVGTDGNRCDVANDRFKYNAFIVIDTVIPNALLGS